MILDWVESRWFGLADLACASLSGVLCYGWPGLGGWPLLIALIPGAVRIAAGRFPFRRTWFDFPLALFLITAAAGVWAAYDRDRAWAKLWIIAAAVALYYALASQPRANLWVVAGLASVCGVAIGGYFMLAADWQTHPANVAILNRVGLWWMSVRPPLPARPMDASIAAGLVALLMPFPMALGLRAWEARRISLGVFVVAMVGLAGAGLLMTSSRAAWLALAGVMGIWITWGLSGYATRRMRWPREWVMALALLGLVGLGVWLTLRDPGGLEALANRVPSGASRLELFRKVLPLVADFPFAGGGLGAFSGLYSRYVMIIPFFQLGYSHNFYLDVALEQGMIGLAALVGVWLGSAALLAVRIWRERETASPSGLLCSTVFAGLMVAGLHGLLDDALYGNLGTPLLFLLTGMAVAATAPESAPAASPALAARRQLQRAIGTGAAIAAGVALLALVYKPGLASWYANLGAVQMARVELAGWPEIRWDSRSHLDELAPAEALFKEALRYDPHNLTAHYRLGLIDGLREDYAAATGHLETVYRAEAGHRGARKTLGYFYVWQGRLNEALPVLAAIPEAGYEMRVYAWWWGTQKRDDLSEWAAQMAVRLDSSSAAADVNVAEQAP